MSLHLHVILWLLLLKEDSRLIVIQRPYQHNLVIAGDPHSKYMAIAINRVEGAEYVVDLYNQRRENSENRIKDLEIFLHGKDATREI